MMDISLILIDDCDRWMLEGRRIWLSSGYPTAYGLTAERDRNGKLKQHRLHRIIMAAPEGVGVDHRNRNKFDLRRDNLRLCLQQDNVLNVIEHKDCQSGVRGVWFDTVRSKWSAQISRQGKRVWLGRFDSKEAAVKVRREAEKRIWGEFAPTYD